MARADGLDMACNRCKVSKPVFKFPQTGRVCKACFVVRAADWAKKNSDRKREWMKSYLPKYREKNRVRLRQKEARWRAKNPDKVREKWKRHYRKCKYAHLWRAARERANKAGLEFTITSEWVKERMAVGFCECTGLRFIESERVGRCGPFTPSIDRIDSSRGYTPDNCRIIVWGLNMALSEWGDEIYLQIAEAYINKKKNDGR